MVNDQNEQIDPYKHIEFDAFLEHIGSENIENWTILAKALKVGRATITRWKHHPKAKKAINDAINKSLQEMRRSGKEDWRMWRDKLKMLGVDDEQTVKHGVTEEAEETIKEMAKKTDYDIFKLVGKQAVAPVQPLQDKDEKGGSGNVQTNNNPAEASAGEGQPQT